MKTHSLFILHLSSLLLLLLVSLSTYAAKSSGAIHKFSQPDGTVISVQLLGDEHFCWYQTTDGVLLKRQGKAFYIGTVTDNGTLENSGIVAHNLDIRSAEEKATASRQNKKKFFAHAESEIAQSKMNVSGNMVTSIEGYPSRWFCPHKGTVKVPVILMNYTDTVFRIGKTDEEIREAFNTYFNSTTKTPASKDTRFQGYSSVKQYFIDASHGNLQFEFDIYGPYTTKYDHDYYGKENGKSDALLKEAVTKANAAGVNFDDYVQQGHDYVNMVCVMYAGAGANISGKKTDFWPACYYNQNISTKGDYKINTICGFPELAIYPYQFDEQIIRAGIGVTCHEMSHGMGLPDIYWTLASVPKDAQGYTDYNNCGPEDWDLMDGGENLYVGIWPCQMSAWEKEILGWKDAIELTEPTDVTLYPLNKENGELYKVVNPANKNEWYIIEAYQNDEWNYYINSLYGSGLMITHVNTYTSSGTALLMSPNNNYGKPNVTILPADGFILGAYSAGTTMQYKGSVITMPGKDETSEEYPYGVFNYKYFYPELQGDPYPGTGNVTSLAAYKNYAGDEMVTKYPITDIKKNEDGSVSFKFMGGTTAINSIREDTLPSDCRIYTIDGRYVGNSQQVLPHGIYIVRGKKIIK